MLRSMTEDRARELENAMTVDLGGVREAMRSYRVSKTHTPVTSIAARCITVYPRILPCWSIAPLAAMQSGNLARMGNIAVMDHTSTKL
jgi:hypothetical protein